MQSAAPPITLAYLSTPVPGLSRLSTGTTTRVCIASVCGQYRGLQRITTIEVSGSPAKPETTNPAFAVSLFSRRVGVRLGEEGRGDEGRAAADKRSREDPRHLHHRRDFLRRQQVAVPVQIAALAEVEQAAVAALALGLVEGLVGEEDQLRGGLDVE